MTRNSQDPFRNLIFRHAKFSSFFLHSRILSFPPFLFEKALNFDWFEWTNAWANGLGSYVPKEMCEWWIYLFSGEHRFTTPSSCIALNKPREEQQDYACLTELSLWIMRISSQRERDFRVKGNLVPWFQYQDFLFSLARANKLPLPLAITDWLDHCFIMMSEYTANTCRGNTDVKASVCLHSPGTEARPGTSNTQTNHKKTTTTTMTIASRTNRLVLSLPLWISQFGKRAPRHICSRGTHTHTTGRVFIHIPQAPSECN